VIEMVDRYHAGVKVVTGKKSGKEQGKYKKKKKKKNKRVEGGKKGTKFQVH